MRTLLDWDQDDNGPPVMKKSSGTKSFSSNQCLHIGMGGVMGAEAKREAKIKCSTYHDLRHDGGVWPAIRGRVRL